MPTMLKWLLILMVAAAVTAGCTDTKKAVVGDYTAVVTDDWKKAYSGNVRKEEIESTLAKTSLSLAADGSFESRAPGLSDTIDTLKGTYTVYGNHVTLKFTGTTREPVVLDFDAGAGTLSTNVTGETNLVYKKNAKAKL